jgi:exodeoxyribonuclease VII large subunit
VSGLLRPTGQLAILDGVEGQESLSSETVAAAPGVPLAPGEPDLPGPYAVGRWASGFRNFLRNRPRVRVIGEVVNLSRSAKATYFDLRDGDGAVPCSIWNSDLKRLELPADALRDGVGIVAAGGPDYFVGSERSSPSFSFRVTYLRLAGEGDLLARLEQLRRQLHSEGLFEPQKQLHRPQLPRTIGVVVGSNSAAFQDILAGLERRNWRGRLVLAHPPVQGQAAAPRIRAAITALAGIPEVETIIVSRGGGSLTDLWAFCDEHLCRAVAMLRVPVISAVGHDVDHTLIDDVAAQACSTPTHAAEAAVRLDVGVARAELKLATASIGRCGRRKVATDARRLGASASGLAGHMRAQRGVLHQKLREVRAASRRSFAVRLELVGRFGLVLQRQRLRTTATLAPETGLERRRLAGLAATLAAHDPARVLERGYAMVSSAEGEVVSSAEAARAAGRINVRFADDDVDAEVRDG